MSRTSAAAHARHLRYLGRPETQPLAESLGARLFDDLGSGRELPGQTRLAVPWLQHQWESEARRAVPPTHVFRVVKGAVLLGRAAPGSLVRLALPLVSNRGRPFVFRDVRRADPRGEFTFRLPYPTVDRPAPEVARHLERTARLAGARAPSTQLALPQTVAAGPALVWSAGWRIEVQVTTRDVLDGHRLALRPAD